MNLRFALLAGAAAALTPMPVAAATPARPAPTLPRATVESDLARLVADFNIPYQTFTMPNGLTVIVMTDRTAPIVYTAITYDVGSTFEPAGKSGFAHLFEHLMFNGSENVPGDYFAPLRDAGLLGINGGTSFDYTNYFEIVPTGSLDRVLYMESDRMGHLLGAVTQSVLDEQRGVVQNEKRNGDNNPSSIVGYASRDAIYPAGHPYGHSVIGSMKDLNAASLADVHQWFRDYYAPNNATMILAGDIDLATAKAKVETYFGDIPRGRETSIPVAAVPVLKAPVERTLTAPVTTTTITRIWPIPGLKGGDDIYALDAASSLMSAIDGAPLREKLVRRDKLFSGVGSSSNNLRGVGEFTVQGTVRNGVDPAVAERALDAAIADFLKTGVSAEALQRFKSSTVINMVHGQEKLEQRAERLLMAATLRGSPATYKADLEAYLRLTPAAVMAAAHKWLDRPAYRAVLKPGPRMTPPGDENAPAAATVAAMPPSPPAAAPAPAPVGTRGPLPPIGMPVTARFPTIEHATLSNGIPVTYAPYTKVPFTQTIVTLPVGLMDDAPDKPNTIAWMLRMLGEGAAGHDDHWFARQAELTGIYAGASAMPNRSSLYIVGPSASIDRALDTGMMLLTRPDFPADRLEEFRRQALARLAAMPTNTAALVQTAMINALAPGSVAARLADIDTPAQIDGITRADLIAAFDRWVRPEGAQVFVTSNEPLSALLPHLEATIGKWHVTGKGPAGIPAPRVQAAHGGTPHIVLIDMPDAVQAVVTGGQLLAIPYDDESLAAYVANTALGGGFLSRINMNLREDKHWSYGASGSFSIDRLSSAYTVATQIQPDKVGRGIAELRKEVKDILSDRPVTQAEFDQAVGNMLRQRIGVYRTGTAVLGGIGTLADRGWPDDFYDTFDTRLKALTLADANGALRKQLDPSKWVWVVAGNAKVIEPQLKDLGLPVTVMTPQQVIARP